MNEILSVDHINIFYKDANQSLFKKHGTKHAVDNVSFTMQSGEILGLIGESGCGKSTIAKAVMGMVPIQSGTVQFEDKHPQMVFQDPFSSLNPSKTVEFLLREPLRNLTTLSTGEQHERALSMLDKVGLDQKYLTHYPRELSGGQRQRISIAAALMLKPKILIADEPVSALDVTVQAQILQLLIDLKKEFGLSILFITHDLRVAYQICNRVMVMRQGKIVEQGETETLYSSPQNEYTRQLLEAADIIIK